MMKLIKKLGVVCVKEDKNARLILKEISKRLLGLEDLWNVFSQSMFVNQKTQIIDLFL